MFVSPGSDAKHLIRLCFVSDDDCRRGRLHQSLRTRMRSTKTCFCFLTFTRFNSSPPINSILCKWVQLNAVQQWINCFLWVTRRSLYMDASTPFLLVFSSCHHSFRHRGSRSGQKVPKRRFRILLHETFGSSGGAAGCGGKRSEGRSSRERFMVGGGRLENEILSQSCEVLNVQTHFNKLEIWAWSCFSNSKWKMDLRGFWGTSWGELPLQSQAPMVFPGFLPTSLIVWSSGDPEWTWASESAEVFQITAGSPKLYPVGATRRFSSVGL